VFIFGAGTMTIYPAIQKLLTPATEIEFRMKAEQARADASLVAPFLSNLSTSDQAKFKATAAALQVLGEASKKDSKGEERPIFAAVNQEILTVAQQIWPSTQKDNIDSSVTKSIDSLAETIPVNNKSKDVSNAYAQLKNSLVYIQVAKNDSLKIKLAKVIMKDLNSNLILAPGIERINLEKIPQVTQVRYFNDTDKNHAEDLAAIITNIVQKSPVITVKPPFLNATEGTLELWLGKD
jgi:phospholipase/lecithinase/hemolysin